MDAPPMIPPLPVGRIPPPLPVSLWLLAAALGVALPRSARAEGSVSYKYQDYQEAAGRIGVRVQSALLDQDVGTAMHFSVTGVMDTIAGATPDGQPERTPGAGVPVFHMEDQRKAWSLDFSRQFSALKVSAGLSNSRESDYWSNGWSLNALADFNTKNTTLLFGLAGTQDEVKVFYQQAHRAKRSFDVIAGVTQLLDPLTTVTANLSYGEASGYLSDPYKLVQKTTQDFPGVFLRHTFAENRPEFRAKWIAFASVNRAFPGLNGALEASGRLHRDDFGVTSATLSLEWYQKLGAHVLVRPSLRLYRQEAADFYVTTLDGTPIVPAIHPTGHAPYYSADYRLSAMQTLNYGMKVIWTVSDAWQVDAAYEQYEMRGLDGRTSPSAYPRAAIATAGIRFAY
jgi:hypothetical protein